MIIYKRLEPYITVYTDNFLLQNNETWYLLQNDEIGLINHWVPENKLELHKQDIRQNKLNQLGIQ